MQIKGSIIVVTGSGKGIGKDIAIEIARLGGICIICSRSKNDIDQTVDEIKKLGGAAFGYKIDLTIEKEVSDFTEWINQKFDGIDVLVNNAGGYPKNFYSDDKKQPTYVWDWSYELWKKTIDINLDTAFLMTKYITPIMISKSSGKIINIGSRMGRIASQMGGYAAAKAALISLTKTTAIQVADKGIEVNAICPTVIDTDSQRIYNKSIGNDAIEMENTTGIINTVKYLIQDAPRTMTGQSIDLFKTV
ncbi:MAG: SDR family NAD(P)-dependent oxidoreductase [Sphaerochaetaceae bacterium]|nr:SDR family NAD(P)-dependent oxidoreductase [Sphaerochaetaceae bacterium]